MTDSFLDDLKKIRWDSLDAKSAVELRLALKATLAEADRWFAELAKQFGYPVPGYTLEPPAASNDDGRPPETVDPPKVTGPVKPSKKRGRPIPALKVQFPKGRKPAPIAVGGADAPQDGPKPAQLFEDSYVSREGPRPGAVLPADHPRRGLHRESSVTPEVDMSDFQEVEEEMRKSGNAGKLFQ